MATQFLPSAEKDPQPAPLKMSLRQDRVPTLEQIRVRAYEKYSARNGAPGSPIIDWLEAERELRGLIRDPAEHPERELKLLSSTETYADLAS